MLISLIVPVYNVSNVLKKTLDSIHKQSLQDMEVLCIDDCSTDCSLEMLKDAAVQDSRIRVLYQEKNMGVGLARKRAVSESKGKYIMFLDGDDSLKHDACEKLAALMEQTHVDILHFGTTIKSMNNISAEEAKKFRNFSKPYREFLERDDLYNACFQEHLFGFSLWNKIYQGDIVRKAFDNFPDVRMDIAEDLLTFFMITCFSTTYGFCDESFYIYNFGGGITGGKTITLKEMRNYAQQGDTLRCLDAFLLKYGWQEKCAKARNWICETFADAAIYNWLLGIGEAQSAEALDIIAPHFEPEDLLRSCVKGLHEWGIQPRKLAEWFRGSAIVSPKKREIKTIAAYYFRAYNGGVERVMTKLASIWYDMGYRVLIITDEPENEQDYPYPNCVARVCLSDLESTEADPLTSRVVNLSKTLQEYKVDLFVSHAWCSPNLLWDILAVKLTGAAMVIHTHSLFSHGYRAQEVKFPIQTALLGIYYDLADGIVTLSDIDTAWWKLWHSRVFHTSNPVAGVYKKEHLQEVQNHDILWIGRISHEKQPFLALQILRIVINRVPDAVLHIVGSADDTAYFQQFKNEIERLGLTKSVIIHGYQTNVDRYYEMCRLCLFTSAYEGFLLTMVESKMNARPCVTFDLKKLDMVREGYGMRIVPQGDTAAAANAIIEILLDPTLWKELSREAYESARPICEFSQSDIWKKIIEGVSVPYVQEATSLEDVAVRIQANDLLTGFELLGNEIRYYREASEWNAKQLESLKHDTAPYIEHSKILEQQLETNTPQLYGSRLLLKKFRTFIRCLKEYGLKETLKIARDKLQKLFSQS